MNILLAILQLMPAIIEAVKAFEAASGGISGIGAEKSAAILDLVKYVFDSGSDLNKKFSWDKLGGAIQNGINVFVKFANAVGLFKKDQQLVPTT